MAKSQPSQDCNERFSPVPWPRARLYRESRAGGRPAQDRQPRGHLPPWGGKSSYTVSPPLGVRAPPAGKRPLGWQAHHPAARGIRAQLWGQLGKQPTCLETSPAGDGKVGAVQSPALLLEETVLFARFALKWPRERQLVWYVAADKTQHKEHTGAWTAVPAATRVSGGFLIHHLRPTAHRREEAFPLQIPGSPRGWETQHSLPVGSSGP